MAASSPSPGYAGVFQAEFTSGKFQYTVTVTEAGSITWVAMSGKGRTEGPRETVPREEILAVSMLTKQTTDEAVSFKLSYIEHQKKNVLRPAHFSFTGTSDDCQQMVDKVQDLIDTAPLRPRKALVIINPVSGNGNGVKTYETKVAPIFASFGLTTNVIVTERAHHAEEIMSQYDLASIDSIVSVGGDGFYHEVANGLLLRTQKESGIDVNDPEGHLKELSIPIGLIPAGTGNGIAIGCHGNFDVETAALIIIRGQRKGSNVCSVFVDGKFRIFSVLLVGYGAWGDIIYTAENKRHLGKLRYLVSMLDIVLLTRPRILDLTLECLKADTAVEPAKETNGVADTDKLRNQDKESTEGLVEASVVGDPELPESEQQVLEAKAEPQVSNASGASTIGTATSSTGSKLVWQREQRVATAVIMFQSDVFGAVVGKDAIEDTGALLINRPCTTWQLAKFGYRLVLFKPNLLEDGLVEHMSLYGLRVKLNSPSNPDTDAGRKEHIVNIDGEVHIVKEPEYEVRLHKGTVKLFYAMEGLTGFLDKNG